MSALRAFGDNAMVCGQIAPEQVAGLAQQGVTMLVNNRPDGEDPGQPATADIAAAAEAAGIAYRFVPIVRGMGPADVDAMQDAVRSAGAGKLLAFCRSGQRSALALALAHRGDGVSRADVEQRLTEAGIDPSPIAHLL